MATETSEVKEATQYSYVKTISPSALTSYIRCPRQYYYSELLKLKDSTPTVHQVSGILLHQILERRNQQKKQNQPVSNTVQEYLDAIEALDTPHKLLIGSSAQVILSHLKRDLYDRLLYIQKAQVKHFIKSALIDYFEQLVLNETNALVLETESWHDIPLTVGNNDNAHTLKLLGQLDLLVEQQNGRLLLIDYKTRKADYKENQDKNQRLLEKNIGIEPKWDETNLSKQFGKRELQLPFYWWLLKQTESYQNKKIDVALQFIRPSYQGGCQLLVLRDEMLAENHPTFEKIILETLLPKILADTTFNATGNSNSCKICQYNQICERGYSKQSDEEFEETDDEGNA